MPPSPAISVKGESAAAAMGVRCSGNSGFTSRPRSIRRLLMGSKGHYSRG
jgi:hypothetical protein